MCASKTNQHQYKNPLQTPKNQNKRALAFQYGKAFTLTLCPTIATPSPDEYKRILKQVPGYLKDRDTCQGTEELATYLRGQSNKKS